MSWFLPLLKKKIITPLLIFLQWYVSEQHQEETLFNGILDKLNLLGTDNKGLYHFDKYLANSVVA